MLTKDGLLIFLALCSLASSQSCFNQFLFRDTCFDNCPPNTVAIQVNGVARCEECDLTKFLVISNDQTRCECALQTYYIQWQDLCAPCHYSCLTCTGPTNLQCSTCQTSNVQTFRRKSGNSCICSPGYIDLPQLQSLRCTKCHQDCTTCTGPAETDCIQCVNGKAKNSLNQCVCTNSFTEDDSGNCVCPFPMVTGPDGVCRDPFTSCGFNQELSLNNAKNIAAMFGAGPPGQCKCKSGLLKIKGKCTTCKPNYVYNQQKEKCQCDKSVGFEVKGQCIICPGDQVYNKKSGECDCKKNSQKTQFGTCYSCPAKSVYTQAGACACIFNYYMAANGKCRKCTKKADNPNCLEVVHNIDKPRQLGRNEIQLNVDPFANMLNQFQQLAAGSGIFN